MKRRYPRRGPAAFGALIALAFSMAVFAGTEVLAGDVVVERVTAEKARSGLWTFSVTLRHADDGWDHYADKWEVLSPDKEILATRVLAHPHVNEQPFTRSVRGVEIPDGLTLVYVRGHDSVHGYSSKDFKVELK
ncbi:MAG: hypothetical protein AAGH38_09440 [Pseudomonadota bacterium]